MTQITLPKTNQTGTNEWADVEDNDKAIRDVVNGNLDDTNFTSPLGGVYRTLAQGAADIQAVTTISPAYLTFGGGWYLTGELTSNIESTPRIIRLVGTDYAVNGKTTKYRLSAQIAVGSTSPGSTVITAGLYPLTVSGGGWTLGTVVAGSTTTSSGLTTNSILPFVGSEFSSLPSDPGNYALGVAVSGATVPAGIHLAVQLQLKHA